MAQLPVLQKSEVQFFNIITSPATTVVEVPLPRGVWALQVIGYVDGQTNSTLLAQIYTDPDKTAGELLSLVGTLMTSAVDVAVAGAKTLPNTPFALSLQLMGGVTVSTSATPAMGVPVPYGLRITFTEVSNLDSANLTLVARRVT